MINYKRNEKIAGILFLSGVVLGVMSVSSIIDGEDYLSVASSNFGSVVFSGISQLLMSLLYLGFALYLLPTLLKHHSTNSYIFITSRILSTVLNIMGIVVMLSILKLSELYSVSLNTPNIYETLGSVLRFSRDTLNHIMMIFVHSIGGLALYFITLRYKLVWNWLSIFGIIASIIALITCIVVSYNKIEIVSAYYIMLSVPIMLVEIAFALTLIFKGLNKSENNKT